MLFSKKTYAGKATPDGTIDYSTLAAAICDVKKRSEDAYRALREIVWPLCMQFYNSKDNRSLFNQWVTKTTGGVHPYDPGWKGPGIFDPVPFYQVEAKLQPIYDAVFGDGDLPFKCTPYPISLGSDDRQEGQYWLDAERRQKRLTAQWYGDMKMHVAGYALLRDTFIYGNVPVLIERSVSMEQDWAQRQDAAGKWGFRAADNVLPVRRMRQYPIPLADFFPDEHGRSMDGTTGLPCEGAVIRYMLTLDVLVSWILGSKELGWNIPAAAQADRDTLREWFATKKGLIGSVTSEDDWPAQMQVDVGRRSTVPSSPSSGDEQRVLVLRYFEGGEDPRHVISAGRDGQGPVLLNQNGGNHPVRNAGIPIMLLQSMPMLNTLFGLSTVEEIMFLAAYNNMLINLDLATRTRASNGITLINPLSGLSAARMTSQPGGSYDVNQMTNLDNALKYIPVPFVNQGIQEIVQSLRQQMHVTAGGVDPLLGFASGETARASMIATEQGSRRWGGEAAHIRNCLVRGGEIMDAYNQQYTTKATPFQQHGETGEGSWGSIGPESYTGKVRVFLDSRVLISNPGARAQAVNTFAATWIAAPGTDLAKLRTEHATALKLPDPEGYTMPRRNRADMENEMFLESIEAGEPRFGEVSPSDAHADHWDKHWEVEPAARQQQMAGKGEAMQQFAAHQEAHRQMGQLTNSQRPDAAPEVAGPTGPAGEAGMPQQGMEPGTTEGGMPVEAGVPAMDEYANVVAQTPGIAPRG